MKKNFIAMAMTLLLCSAAMITPVSGEWREVSDEELIERGLMLPEEEENAIIQAQRGNRAITDEQYAALYAPERGDLDCITDINTAEEYFGESGMGYITERYVNPTFTNINRLYFCTDVLVYAGHGLPDRVRIEPRMPGLTVTSDQKTGVHMGSSTMADGDKLLAGLGRKSMSDCRFVMFAACQTANRNATNIAQSVVKNGAESSIGWEVDVNSTGLHTWERTFLRYVENGSTLEDAKIYADTIHEGQLPKDVFTSAIYGNGNIRLSKNRSKEALEIPEFIQVDEKLNIDCENEDLEELTNYFEANIRGFSSDLFKVELINNYMPDENHYMILYGLQVNGFETPCKVIAFVQNDSIKYKPLDESRYEKIMAMPMTFAEKSFEKEIEIAKREAVEEVSTDSTVDYQEVTKTLNQDLVPVLQVKTAFVDDMGCRFATLYEYKLLDEDSI